MALNFCERRLPATGRHGPHKRVTCSTRCRRREQPGSVLPDVRWGPCAAAESSLNGRLPNRRKTSRLPPLGSRLLHPARHLGFPRTSFCPCALHWTTWRGPCAKRQEEHPLIPWLSARAVLQDLAAACSAHLDAWRPSPEEFDALPSHSHPGLARSLVERYHRDGTGYPTLLLGLSGLERALFDIHQDVVERSPHLARGPTVAILKARGAGSSLRVATALGLPADPRLTPLQDLLASEAMRDALPAHGAQWLLMLFHPRCLALRNLVWCALLEGRSGVQCRSSWRRGGRSCQTMRPCPPPAPAGTASSRRTRPRRPTRRSRSAF